MPGNICLSRSPVSPRGTLAGDRPLTTVVGDVIVVLDERAFARWDTAVSDWSVAPGAYQVLVGRSAAGLTHTLEVSL